MSDINLREYLHRLDHLVQEGSADEVLWHARHVLQYYPKNVIAYRHIGRALLMLGRWDDSNAALRRVLSVVPNDAQAHRMLSEISQRKGQNDQAIWHMERAFEQDPNDTEIMGELQKLYRQYRNIANPRLQLTTAAVARQNIRSGELDRAIENLRAALARSSGRADLRLLLAEALWQQGEIVDAAETAMDVLHAYPDSLTANRMLAELWLSEGRPSDAQQYINRLEAIDPYLALELVQKQAPPDDTFMLPELDYQRSAQAAMMGQSHDWLQGFDAPPAEPEPIEEKQTTSTLMLDDVFSDMSETAAVAPADEDWLNDLDAIELNYNLSTGALQSTTSPLVDEPALEDELPDFIDMVAEQPMPADWATQGLPDEPQGDDPLAWMKASEEVLDDIEHTEADPLAWMKNSGVEVNDEPALAAPQNDDDAPLEAEESDPLGWLGGYHTEVMNQYEEERLPAPPEPELRDLSVRDTDEILSPTFGQSPTPADTLDFDDELPFPELDDILYESTAANDALDRPTIPVTMPLPHHFIEDEPQAEPVVDEWELNQQLLDESLGLEELVNPTNEAQETDVYEVLKPLDDVLLPKTAPLPPMPDSYWAEDVPQATTLPTDRGTTMPDENTPNFDWLNEDEPKDEGESSTGATGMLDWLAQAQDAEAAGEVPPDAAGNDSASTGSTGMLNWLSSSDNPAYDVPAPEEAPESSTGSTGMINWLSQNRPLPPTLPLGSAESDAPDAQMADSDMSWLNELEGDDLPAEVNTPVGSGATEMLDWLGESDTDEVLTGTEAEAASAAPAEDAWLQSLYADEPAPEVPAPQAQWDAEIALDEAEEAQSEAAVAPAEALADWLNETNLPSLSEDAPTTEAEVVSPEAALQDWLAETADDVMPDAVASADVVEETDWLPTPVEAGYSAEPMLDFLSLEGATGSLGDEPVEPSFSAPEPEAAQEVSGADEIDWFADETNAIVAELQPIDDAITPDAEAEAWFAQVSPIEDFGLEEEFELAEAQADESPVAIEQQDAYAEVLLDPAEAQALPDWMSDVAEEGADDAVAEAPAETYAPADMSAVIDAYESDLPQEAEAEPYGYVDEAETEAEPPSSATAVTAALIGGTALLRDDGQEDEPQPVIESIDDFADENEWDLAEVEASPIAELDRLEADAYDALEETAIGESGEVAIEAADNAPDWLNAMVPGLDIDYSAGEDEPLETEYLEESTASTPAIPENFGWLNEIVDEETRADEPAPVAAVRAPRFVFSRPPLWLRRLLEKQAAPDADDDDLPEWLR